MTIDKLFMQGDRMSRGSGVRRKKFRGVQGYVRPRRGSPENFRKFAKIFLEKIAKMHYFGLFFK